MAFENSPKLDGTAKLSSSSLARWIYNRRRVIWIAVGIMFALLIALLLLRSLASRPPDLPIGGLDGCLISEDGNPVTANIQIANSSMTTYEDGCFFFTSLPPG
ncbi:MAG: hypothetical protein U9Q82_00170, partial [Chloroflexota bacterium]|nr:hypothetical protein [Chloroflexota bacterium]